MRSLYGLGSRPGAQWNENGLLLDWTQAMVKCQQWCWPLVLSEGIISTILLLTQSHKELQDWTNRPSEQCEAIVAGIKY